MTGRAAAAARNDSRWLIVFADLAAVLLSFFVLLFAMGDIDQGAWQGMTGDLQRRLPVASDSVTTRAPVAPDIRMAGRMAGTPERPAAQYRARVLSRRLAAMPGLAAVRVHAGDAGLAIVVPVRALLGPVPSGPGLSDSGLSDSGRAAGGITGAGQALLSDLAGLLPHAPVSVTVETPSVAAGGWVEALNAAAAVSRGLQQAGLTGPSAIQARPARRPAAPRMIMQLDRPR